MPHPVADILLTAAELNRQDERRSENVIRFKPEDIIIVVGDLHGNRDNLLRIIKHAALGVHPERHIVLQELIHGGPTDSDGGDRSFELVLRAARLKDQYPEQVHFILANHDTAEMTGNEITKDGAGTCRAFQAGLDFAFDRDAGEINHAIRQFFGSFALAAKCPNGIMITHSLPSPGREKFFDKEILDRPYTKADLKRGQSVYELVWGRRQTAASLDTMSKLLGAGIFINGHQPQDNGYVVNGRQLIITSDHAYGVIAQFGSDEEIELDLLDTIIRRITSL